MKKLLLPLSFSVLVAVSSSAQITLNQASFASASTSGTDTLYTTASNPTYPSLSADAGGNLDFSTVTSVNNPAYLYRVAATSGSQWADSEAMNFSGFIYHANIESSLTAGGYIVNGEHVYRSAYSLLAAGIPFAVSSDSIIINGQDIVFSAPLTRMAFPATNQTTWSSTYKYDFDFTLTYGALSLNNAAGIVRAYIAEKDTVIGYGKVRVIDKSGYPSGYADVLQVESMTSTTDSFFINGSPASPTLLAGFNVTQGQTTVAKQQNYLRAGHLYPLVHIDYDATNTTPKSANTDAATLPVFIPETEVTRTISVYPNPVTGRTITVGGAPANYGNWNYELESVTGQVVTKGMLQMSNNQSKTEISLPLAITPGTYFLHMLNYAVNQETVKTLIIQ